MMSVSEGNIQEPHRMKDLRRSEDPMKVPSITGGAKPKHADDCEGNENSRCKGSSTGSKDPKQDVPKAETSKSTLIYCRNSSGGSDSLKFRTNRKDPDCVRLRTEMDKSSSSLSGIESVGSKCDNPSTEHVELTRKNDLSKNEKPMSAKFIEEIPSSVQAGLREDADDSRLPKSTVESVESGWQGDCRNTKNSESSESKTETVKPNREALSNGSRSSMRASLWGSGELPNCAMSKTDITESSLARDLANRNEPRIELSTTDKKKRLSNQDTPKTDKTLPTRIIPCKDSNKAV